MGGSRHFRNESKLFELIMDEGGKVFKLRIFDTEIFPTICIHGNLGSGQNGFGLEVRKMLEPHCYANPEPNFAIVQPMSVPV